MGIIHVSAVFPLLVLIATFESVLSLTITAYHQCLDLGALNPSDVSTLNTIGLQQCMRECLGDRTCLSLNYWRNDLRCTQHRVKTGGPYGLVPDSECIYIERQDLPMTLAPVCSTSHCQGVCKPVSHGGLLCETNGTTAFLKASILNITMPQPTTTSSLPQTATTISTTPAVTTTTTTISTTPTFTTTTTTTTTTPAPTCPSDYKWDPNIPFCHKITTDPKESWPNARAACQTVGADLAIIDVSAKFSKILSDPDRPFNSFNHWMGGIFNTTTNSYYWIDGRDVGATFSTTYGLSGAADTCLYWYDMSPQTREKKCTVAQYSYVCEYRNGLY